MHRVRPSTTDPQVPLSYMVRRVPRRQHGLRHHVQLLRHPLAGLLVAVPRHPASHEGSPRWGAPGVGVMACQCDALLRHPVHVRCVEVTVVVADVAPAEVIHEPEDDVRPRSPFGGGPTLLGLRLQRRERPRLLQRRVQREQRRQRREHVVAHEDLKMGRWRCCSFFSPPG